MGPFIANLTGGGATPALEATLAFTHARHRVIADNVANLTTPGYKARHLDPGAFQKALAKAMEPRKRAQDPFILDDGKTVRTNRGNQLEFMPKHRPGSQVVFHDGTNVSIEQEMSDLASNAMLNEMASTLLDGYYDALRKAIRGRQ